MANTKTIEESNINELDLKISSLLEELRVKDETISQLSTEIENAKEIISKLNKNNKNILEAYNLLFTSFIEK